MLKQNLNLSKQSVRFDNYFSCVKNIVDFGKICLVKQVISTGKSLHGKVV